MKLMLLLVLVVLAVCLFWPTSVRSQSVKGLEIGPIAQAQLIALYSHHTIENGVEFMACGMGTESDSMYSLQWVTIPAQAQYPTSVNFDIFTCQKREGSSHLNIIIHSHPGPMPSPYMSDTDWRTFYRSGGDYALIVWSWGEAILVTAYHRNQIPIVFRRRPWWETRVY